MQEFVHQNCRLTSFMSTHGLRICAAAANGHADVVRLLLQAEIDKDKVDFLERTPTLAVAPVTFNPPNNI